MKGKPLLPAQRLHALKRALQKSKQRQLFQHMLQCSPLLFVLALLSCLLLSQVYSQWPIYAQYTLLLCAPVFIFVLGFVRPSYRQITYANLAKDLNRRFSTLEESCALLFMVEDNTSSLGLTPEQSLTSLQRLQFNRSANALDNLIHTKDVDLAARYPLKVPTFINIATGLVCFILWYFVAGNPQSWIGQSEHASLNGQANSTSVKADRLASIITAQLDVTPPPYALGINGYTTHQRHALDAQVLAGSQATWRIDLSARQSQYSLKFSDNDSLALTQDADGIFTGSKVIHRSSVYQVLDEKQRVVAVHTLMVTADEAPKITFIAPQATITEIPSYAEGAKPVVYTQALIKDDFALGKVEIIASVAKGSGESVKFRDSVFTFDTVQSIAGEQVYNKSWDLVALGMAPGDELYFSIRAWDNRQPDPQLSRSSSKIVRWLDEDTETVFSEGTLVDNMPAYFKSQRQIIIDTKALIANEAILNDPEFKQTSGELGIAQADLKHKYGQFVGDEISGIVHTMEGGANTEQFDQDNHEEHADDEKEDEHKEHSAHSKPDAMDKSGYQTAIEQFGHAHGETDVAIFKTQDTIEQNPRVMMKRAIGYMWQAESQLRLNRPQDALPHEEQALLWLNRAKKAERIYVKRLGFEPPPVSEKRRYQGKLDDIENNVQQHPTVQNDSNIQALQRLIALLNAPMQSTMPFNNDELAILQDANSRLQNMLDEDPNVIRILALLAQIESAKQRHPTSCELCAERLQAQLWQLLPPAQSSPAQLRRPYSNTQPAIKHYAEFLRIKEHP